MGLKNVTSKDSSGSCYTWQLGHGNKNAETCLAAHSQGSVRPRWAGPGQSVEERVGQCMLRHFLTDFVLEGHDSVVAWRGIALFYMAR